MIQCRNCRTTAPAGSRFCNGCGAPLALPDPNVTMQGAVRRPDPNATVYPPAHPANGYSTLHGAGPEVVDPNRTAYGAGRPPQAPPDPNRTAYSGFGRPAQAAPAAGYSDPNATHYGQPAAVTGQYAAPTWSGQAPGYPGPEVGPYAAPTPPRKRSFWLLAALIALVIGGAGTASVLLLRPKGGAVTGAQPGRSTAGPGLQL
ncbi:MAG: hypothetical protein FJX77_08640, partial [Armatimonadetes bacterium]|nr:hypothetical protein [Armatimonadota bacterium]